MIDVAAGKRWDAAFAKVVDAYASLGFPHRVIGQWSLPHADVAALLREFEARRPKRILEVGTFVGLTTQLLAHFAEPGAQIHTVDPNLELAEEFAALGSHDYGADTSVRAMDLARRAAESLAHSTPITFHEGGFSTGATFHSSIVAPDKTVHVCGPEVCEQNGPFDFVFLDGLHFEEAVLSDLELIAPHVAEDGCIVLHDVIGMWGSNVRRAVFRFLDRHAGYELTHEPYANVYHAIGVLERTDRKREDDRGHALLGAPARVKNLASLLVRKLAMKRVVVFGSDPLGVGDALARHGVDVTTEQGATDQRFDVALCLDVVDELDRSEQGAVLDRLTACSDTIVLGTSPPGQGGPQPMISWSREFLRRGFLFEDALRPGLEPQYFPNLRPPVFELDHGWLLNLQIARRADDLAGALERVNLDKDARIEDLSLQQLYLGTVIRQYVQREDGANSQLQQLGEQNSTLQSQLAEEHERLLEAQDETRRVRADLAAMQDRAELAEERLQRTTGELTDVRDELATTLARDDFRFGKHLCLRYPRIARALGRLLRIDTSSP